MTASLLVPPALSNNVVFINTLGNRESVDLIHPTLNNSVVGIMLILHVLICVY
jgi:hypothetical protein